jgi:hypothetical protein
MNILSAFIGLQANKPGSGPQGTKKIRALLLKGRPFESLIWGCFEKVKKPASLIPKNLYF